MFEFIINNLIYSADSSSTTSVPHNEFLFRYIAKYDELIEQQKHNKTIINNITKIHAILQLLTCSPGYALTPVLNDCQLAPPIRLLKLILLIVLRLYISS